ncbi:hypothetical protein T440DRAFT_476840 [Plenodomus tracheiphilus IPT5]|uniref:Uncharacterized protein n=1 Tax=Plenodomus tracheiphilus IPT5 TaxID=1408161 RepID=A0A6A7BGI2_9PLEO|nr:hypothetical protein T440DRAFT_476840 [Plenodomus tracheiphilus IPT5]
MMEPMNHNCLGQQVGRKVCLQLEAPPRAPDGATENLRFARTRVAEVQRHLSTNRTPEQCAAKRRMKRGCLVASHAVLLRGFGGIHYRARDLGHLVRARLVCGCAIVNGRQIELVNDHGSLEFPKVNPWVSHELRLRAAAIEVMTMEVKSSDRIYPPHSPDLKKSRKPYSVWLLCTLHLDLPLRIVDVLTLNEACRARRIARLFTIK